MLSRSAFELDSFIDAPDQADNAKRSGAQRCCGHHKCLRRVFCWTGFLAFLFVEVYRHVVYGFDVDVLEAEEECGLVGMDCKLNSYTEITEGLCRVFLSVIMFDGILQMFRAVYQRRVRDYFHPSWVGEDSSGRCCTALAYVFAGFTLYVGIRGMLHWEDPMPLWVLVYCHVADALCAAVITSGLSGLLADLILAARLNTWSSFFLKLLMCDENVETHSAIGDHDLLNVEYGGSPRTAVEISILWIVFVASTWGYYLSLGGSLSEPWSTILESMGVLCWVGIAWWMVETLYALPSRLNSLGEKSIFAWVPRLRRPVSQGADDSDEDNDYSSCSESSSGLD